MKNEIKFYDALQNIFVGAPIEGKGGYVNLLKIKEKYYGKTIENFKAQISSDAVITGGFKEEFYDLLYSFFNKYFSECGSVYFTQTANWQRVYEKVYSDNKDVVLFWKTHMLYYVKSDMLFNSIYVKTKDRGSDNTYVFFFDVGTLKQKQNNEKKELVFELKKTITESVDGLHNAKSGDKTFVLSVSYSERGKKTDILGISSKTGIPTAAVENAINSFKKQTTVDFFINKNAKRFLEEQLELFLHQYLLDDDSIFDQSRLTQIKAVKKYAKLLIGFISQFENELVRIWNKPKFVRNSNYVITLDRLTPELVQKLIASPNMTDQIEEWIKFGFVKDGFEPSEKELKSHPHLPFDTKYFKEYELEILSLFNDLDEALDGRLIHSENYQALSTLKTRYAEQIQCIYIDPPFNTGNDFEYMDEYQDSSWLSIMRDRLECAKEMLSRKGAIFVHLDHCSEHRGRELLDELFDKNNFLNNIAWSYRSGGASDAKALPYKHDSILFYAKDKSLFKLNPVHERQYFEKNFMGAKKDDAGRYYADTLLRDIIEGEINDPITGVKYNVRKVLNLSDEFYSFKNSQKPEGLLHLLLTLTESEEKSTVLDFFAGSGPTLAVAAKTGKKYIGIEMGEHFGNFYTDTVKYKNSPKNKKDLYNKFSVISVEETDKHLSAVVEKVGLLGRMKEVAAQEGRHEPCGISRLPNAASGGFFKYYDLEQYEDTLDRAVYSSDTEPYTTDIGQYIFFADRKLTDVLDIYDGGINIDFGKLYGDIDLPETISLLMGKPIKHIDADFVTIANVDSPIKYNIEKMNDAEKTEFVRMLKPLLWWGE